MTQRPSECAFCGGTGKKSREDFFPVWSQEIFPIYAKQSNNSFSKTVRPIDAGQAVIKAQCIDCNSGWMSQLQNEAKVIISSSILDESPRTIDENEARRLAHWVTMTMMVFDLHGEGRSKFDFEQRYEFAFKGMIPKGLSAWVGITGEAPTRGVSISLMDGPDTKMPLRDAPREIVDRTPAVFTYVLGRFLAFAMFVGENDVVRPYEIPTQLANIWPLDVSWPKTFSPIAEKARTLRRTIFGLEDILEQKL